MMWPWRVDKDKHVHTFGPWKVTKEWSKIALNPEREVGQIIEQRRTCTDPNCKWTEVDKQEWSIDR